MNISGKYMYNIYLSTFFKRYYLKINKTKDPSYDMKRQGPSKDTGEFTFCLLATAVQTVYP